MGTHVLLRSVGQAYRGPRTAPDPERSLMIAVLEDAIDCISKSRVRNGPRRRVFERVFEKEKRWFLDEDTRWLYSFACICETLELDANAVRESLGLVPRAPSIGAERHARRRPARSEDLPKRAGSVVA
jgi:hypothetical protein